MSCHAKSLLAGQLAASHACLPFTLVFATRSHQACNVVPASNACRPNDCSSLCRSTQPGNLLWAGCIHFQWRLGRKPSRLLPQLEGRRHLPASWDFQVPKPAAYCWEDVTRHPKNIKPHNLHDYVPFLSSKIHA